MTSYKSKIGLEIVIPIGIILTFNFVLIIFTKAWAGLPILLLVVFFFFYLFNSTIYHITEDCLIVKCGVFINKKICLDHITRIIPTRNPISAPANSLDRLEIFYNSFDSSIISPLDKEGFILQLKKSNPFILVKLQ